MLAIAVTAKMWMVRPSALMCLTDPVTALNFDMAAVMVLREAERERD
jgi:hypothetical protein